METKLAQPALAHTSLPFPSNPNNLTNTLSKDEIYEYVNEKGQIVEYDLNRLVFCETKAEKIPAPANASGPPLINYRINLQDRRPDGVLQDLIVRTEELFTYGISESVDQKTGELNGYSLPIPMWNQDGATPSQKYITDFFDKLLLTRIKEHLVEVRKTFKQPDLEMRDLRKMKFFYRKKDPEGAINLEDPPTWYPKLLVSKKKGFKIISRFYLLDSVDAGGNLIELDPEALIQQMGKCKATIKIESIYIRSEGISVQCKLWEADIKPGQNNLVRKGRINPNATVVSVDDNNPLSALLLSNKDKRKKQEDTETPPPNGEVHAGGDITVTDAPVGNPFVALAATGSAQPAPPPAAAPAAPVKKTIVRTVTVKKPAT